MCKKYPGLRCGNPIHERVESLSAQVEEAKAFRDALNPDVVKGNEITKASRQVTILEARLKDAQQKYDATDAGYFALEASVEDDSLSRAELTELKVRLKDAAKERADREKVLSDSEARKANVMAYLEEAGVPANERADFSDANIYMPASGSAKHYEQIRANRSTAYQNRVAEFYAAETKAKASGDPADRKKVEEAELAVAKAKSDYAYSVYVCDATAKGIEILKAKIAKTAVCYTTADVITRTKLERRLANAERAHRLNLDSRNYRNAKLAALKATVSAHGGDVAGAVAAFKNKNPLPKSAKKRVPVEHMRSSKVYSHLTERDTAVIDAEFKQSPEFKAGGDDARARFIERKIMTPPHELYLRESLDEADAKVTIASNGRTGRNNTVIDLEQGRGIARDQTMGVCLTERSAEILKSRAGFVHTSVSTLIRDSLLGRNPLARENDRSALSRAKKRAKASEILMNGLIAA